MCYGQLAELWEKSDEHIPGMKEMSKIMQTDSQNVQRIANAVGFDWLEEEAKRNADNPSEGIAKASVATGLGFMGAGLNNWLGGGQGGVNVGSSMSAAPGPGVVANGMQGSAIMDSMLINAGYPQAAGGGFTGLAGGGGAGTGNAMKLAQMGSMMQQPQQQQPMMAPMPRPQQQYEPLPMLGQQSNSLGYGMPKMMTEEEKRRLRLMGYQI